MSQPGNLLVKHQKCYASNKNNVMNVIIFSIRLKQNASLFTQRPPEVPIHYRDILNNSLKELETHNIMKEFDSSPEDKSNYDSTNLNPFIIILKGESFKCVLDNLLNHCP